MLSSIKVKARDMQYVLTWINLMHHKAWTKNVDEALYYIFQSVTEC